MKRYFFDQTNVLHDEIVSLHDFILPTSTALWHFRGVIDEELANDPNIKIAVLAKKYNIAPGTRGTTNLVVPFRDHSWDMQRERLAETALVGIIALYEIWCEQICEQFGKPDLAVKLQHPTNAAVTSGVRFAISQLSASPSPLIANSIFLGLSASRKYSLSKIDNLLKCFRYFKELRNCLMHRGRVCEGRLYGAQSEFIPVATKSALSMGFVPVHGVYKLGDPVSLALHGVLGFTDVILRIITTVDAELSKTTVGQAALVQRMATENQTPMLERKLRNAFITMGWKGVQITTDLANFLRTSKITT